MVTREKEYSKSNSELSSKIALGLGALLKVNVKEREGRTSLICSRWQRNTFEIII